MSTTTSVRQPPPVPVQRPATHHLAGRLLAAALVLGVAYIHVKDQGGFPGEKTPGYVGIGYYLLEATAVLAAVGLLLAAGRHTLKAWALTAAISVGALTGYVLSRGPGLPDYTDDKGNWTEPIGLASLIVEGSLLLLAGFVFLRSRRAAA